jgi:hypothetical protein
VKKVPVWAWMTIEDSKLSHILTEQGINTRIMRQRINFVIMAYIKKSHKPSNYGKAKYEKKWKEAKDEEYDSLMKRNTWELIKLPIGLRHIGVKCIYKIKYHANDQIAKL